MIKSKFEIEYEQLTFDLDKELGLFSEQLSKPNSFQKINRHVQKLNQFYPKMKSINSTLNKIDTEIQVNSRNKNYNKFDLKDKKKKYQLTKKKLQEKYNILSKLVQELKRQNLITSPQNSALNNTQNNGMIEMENMKKANDIMFRYQGVNKELEETHEVTKETNYQLKKQGALLQQMKGDLKTAQSQLSMGDQLMRIISNRSLITKLILILLVGFMGLADVLLLIIKLM